MNGRLIVLVDEGNHARADSGEADGGGVDGGEFSIRTRDVGGPGAAEGVRLDIVVSEFRTPILLSSYLNIAILSRLTMYRPQRTEREYTEHKKPSENVLSRTNRAIM